MYILPYVEISMATTLKKGSLLTTTKIIMNLLLCPFFSTGCTEDYVQIYRGASIAPGDLVVYSGFPEGRICESSASRFIFSLEVEVLTFYYHTDGRNSISNAQGLEISFEPKGNASKSGKLEPFKKIFLLDIDECTTGRHDCHTCTNTIGSFECDCNPGYYLSLAAKKCYGE